MSVRLSLLSSLILIFVIGPGCHQPEPSAPKPPLDVDVGDTGAGDTQDDTSAETGDPGRDVGEDSTEPPPTHCELGYTAAESRGVVTDAELVETSGLAASRLTDGLLWAHNDSGDQARLFALDTTGRTVARLSITGARARDYEDMASATCPDGNGPCLWVGDIGDNSAVRTDLVVYVVREPPVDLTSGTVAELSTELGWSFPISYPSGPFDAEALVVAPDGSTFTIFEKTRDGRAAMVQHPGPLTSGTPTEMILVTEMINPKLITAADLHATGRLLLVRTYDAVYEYRIPEDKTLADIDALSRTNVGTVPEPQGEALAYDRSGRGLWTLSENGFTGQNQPLYFWGCRN